MKIFKNKSLKQIHIHFLSPTDTQFTNNNILLQFSCPSGITSSSPSSSEATVARVDLCGQKSSSTKHVLDRLTMTIAGFVSNYSLWRTKPVFLSTISSLSSTTKCIAIFLFHAFSPYPYKQTQKTTLSEPQTKPHEETQHSILLTFFHPLFLRCTSSSLSSWLLAAVSRQCQSLLLSGTNTRAPI